MKKLFIVVPLALCASVAMADDLQAKVEDMMLKSFQANGIATLERQKQDTVQKACSSPTLPDAETMKRLEAAEMATIKWPADGHYIDGDFTHLTYLFLDGHFLEPILDVGFDFGVRRDGRRDGLSFCT